jgi:BirA family biotin operon repressor/biotin-[acetyl-CoA-carboxylase] ligase
LQVEPIIGKPFIELIQAESTNNYAMQQIKDGMAQTGTIWFTKNQTNGKGQRGKVWNSENGKNLAYTAIINPQNLFAIQQPFILSAVVAVACCNFFNELVANNALIKWPNDIYWNDRKAAGILIENIIVGNQWNWAIIGIGINVNQTAFKNLPNPVSIKQITGRDFNIIELAKKLTFHLNTCFNILKLKGFEEIINSYNELLYKKGEIVKFKKETRTFNARVLLADSYGRLHISDSLESSLEFGSVSWVS